MASEESVDFCIKSHEPGGRDGYSSLSYFSVVFAGYAVAPTYRPILVRDTDMYPGRMCV